MAELQADEFVILPCTDGEWLARSFAWRAQRDRTRTPDGASGNTIIREIEACLQRREAFAVAYLDLDHFAV